MKDLGFGVIGSIGGEWTVSQIISSLRSYLQGSYSESGLRYCTLMLLLGGLVSDDQFQTNELVARIIKDVPFILKDSFPKSRFVGFDVIGKPKLRFFGMETNSVPRRYGSGLSLLELNQSRMRLENQPSDGKKSTVTESLAWQWRTECPVECGDFVAWLESDYWEPRFRGKRLLSMRANAFHDNTLNVFPDEVRLVPYDTDWQQQYAQMERWLISTLGPRIARRVEHYGSTAIPGMPAKPIVDILVEIPSFEVASPAVIPALSGPLWEYWASHDHLRSNATARQEYLALKQDLASRYRIDREAYTIAKTRFVTEMTNEALR